jgi:hypothetical protein
MMATLTLEAIATWREERATARRGASDDAAQASRWTGWILGGVVVLAILMGLAASNTVAPSGVRTGVLGFRFAFFAVLVSAVVWTWMRGLLGSLGALGLLGALTVLDLWVVDHDFFQTVPGPEEMFAADDVVQFLQTRPGHDRVWVLPFPAGAVYRGQVDDYLMHFDIDQAGGEHGNQLQRFNEYAGAGEQTYVDWHNFLTSASFLNAANVRYLITGAQLQEPWLREVHRGSAFVYENPGALPRAWLVASVVNASQPDGALAAFRQPGFDPRTTAVVNASSPVVLPQGELQGSATLRTYSPDRVEVATRANREALLVLADNYYEGWTARVDGTVRPIVRTNHTFRGVVVPAGSHTVEFTFHPGALYTGLYVYLACLGLLAVAGAVLLVGSLRGRRVAAEG